MDIKKTKCKNIECKKIPEPKNFYQFFKHEINKIYANIIK